LQYNALKYNIKRLEVYTGINIKGRIKFLGFIIINLYVLLEYLHKLGYLKQITAHKLFNMVVIYFPFLQLHPSRGPPKLISLFRSLLLSLQLHFSSLSSLSSSENIRKREDYSTENTQWKFITSMKFLFCEYTG
jgi:hypothetical protein